MNHRILLLLATGGLVAAPAFAVSPSALDAAIKSGTPLTIIDLRPTVYYQRSHIPGAISLPAEVIPTKQLPALGRVVAYCDGLGATYAADCVAALNQKPGITAEALDGGFAGWETYTTRVTSESNFRPQVDLPMITYDQLRKTTGTGVTLVDARRPGPDGAALADLAPFCRDCVPNAQLTASPLELLKRYRGIQPTFLSAPSLLVVIGSTDETAHAQAKEIVGTGYKRVVILAGGEEIIRRQGRAGLTRGSTAASIVVDPQLKPVPADPAQTTGSPSSSSTSTPSSNK